MEVDPVEASAAGPSSPADLAQLGGTLLSADRASGIAPESPAPNGYARVAARRSGRIRDQLTSGASLLQRARKAAAALDALTPRLSAGWRGVSAHFAGRRVTRPRGGNAPSHSAVQVERDDRLATICGKLDAARLPDVALLIPRGNVELEDVISMRLLMRHADLTGKSIVLVTRRPGVRRTAHSEHQATVASEGRVRFVRTGPGDLLLGGLDLPIPGLSTLALVGAAGLCACLAVIVALWYGPSATVTLFPVSAAASQVQLVSIQSVANRLNLADAVVPAERRRVTVSRTVLLPTTGSATIDQAAGDPIVSPAVSDADIAAAQRLAAPALADEAMTTLASSYRGAERFFRDSAQVQVASVEPVQKSGEPASFLQVTYRGSVTVLGARESDFRALFTALLKKTLAKDHQLIDSSIKISVIRSGPYDKSADGLQALMRIDAASAAGISTNRISDSLRGRSRRDALSEAGRAVKAARSPSLKLWPDWAPWLPRAASRVHVDLGVAGPEAR